MARSRNIKPATFKNELLGQADPMLTLLFINLWCLADREGRLEDRPLRIKAETFPYRENIDINGYLTELERLKFIYRYSVGDLKIIQVVNFLAHQNPHKTEKHSELPKYDENSMSCEITVKEPLKDVEITEAAVLIPDSLLLIPDSLSDTNVSLETGVSKTKEIVSTRKNKNTLDKSDLIKIGFNEQIGQDFLTLRKAKNLPLTVTALKSIISAGKECSLNPNETLLFCIESNWGGFKVDWYRKSENKNKADVVKRQNLSDFVFDKNFRWDE